MPIPMEKTTRKTMVGFALAFFLASVGCTTPNDPLGADIRKELGVTKNSAEETKDDVKRNYDPKVILKRSEALYQAGEYIEAAGEYQHFLDLHPLHQWADYAQLKLGMSYFQQFTTIDRDPEPAQKALESFQKLLSTYPNTKYADEARKRISICQERLARYQFYVGHFYYKQEAYPAAIRRFEQILITYPNDPIVMDTLYYLALSYGGEGKPEQAVARLQDLIVKYPASPYRTKARQLLDQLNNKPRS
ncbi:MAG TPA: outer membrane protein assembly factor BamD [Nitrospiria bacterium]|nr:outer membrane protein assembly factor BamD [Nitrospiria bacterium]